MRRRRHPPYFRNYENVGVLRLGVEGEEVGLFGHGLGGLLLLGRENKRFDSDPHPYTRRKS